MSDTSHDNASPMPYSPPVKAHERYALFKQFRQDIAEITAPEKAVETNKNKLFELTITVSTIEGGSMDTGPAEPTQQLNEQFLIDLVFKPNASGQRLRPAESQLLLAYIGEILKEIETEEQQVIEEEKLRSQQEETCKHE